MEVVSGRCRMGVGADAVEARHAVEIDECRAVVVNAARALRAEVRVALQVRGLEYGVCGPLNSDTVGGAGRRERGEWRIGTATRCCVRIGGEGFVAVREGVVVCTEGEACRHQCRIVLAVVTRLVDGKVRRAASGYELDSGCGPGAARPFLKAARQCRQLDATRRTRHTQRVRADAVGVPCNCGPVGVVRCSGASISTRVFETRRSNANRPNTRVDCRVRGVACRVADAVSVEVLEHDPTDRAARRW